MLYGGLLEGIISLVVLFIIGAAACFVGGFMGFVGVKLASRVFGPLKVRMVDNHAKTFE